MTSLVELSVAYASGDYVAKASVRAALRRVGEASGIPKYKRSKQAYQQFSQRAGVARSEAGAAQRKGSTTAAAQADTASDLEREAGWAYRDMKRARRQAVGRVGGAAAATTAATTAGVAAARAPKVSTAASMARQGAKADKKMASELASRSGSKKYEEAAPGLMVRSRRIGRGNADAATRQLASDRVTGQGSEQVYLRQKYPRLGAGGLTAPTPKGTSMDINAPLLPTKRNRGAARYIATHEGEHHRRMSGKPISQMLDPAIASARRKGADVDTPMKWWKRMKPTAAVSDEALKIRATEEGAADAAAMARHKMKGPWGGYPQIAQMDPTFGNAYVKAGGKKASDVDAAAVKRRLKVVGRRD